MLMKSSLEGGRIMLRDERLYPIQPDISQNTSNYKESILCWNPFTNNYAVFFEFEITKESKQEFCLLPDGCVELILKCCKDNPQLIFWGKRTKMSYLTFDEGYTYFGFRPFYEVGYNTDSFDYLELIDDYMDLTSDLSYEILVSKLCGCVSFEERCNVFFEFGLIDFILDKSITIKHAIECSRQICDSKGLIYIGDLGKKIGYSDRQIRRFYKNTFGITPMDYKKIIRFQNSIHTLSSLPESQKADYASISKECGYYDQSYMIGDYKKFVGKTPKQLCDHIFNT